MKGQEQGDACTFIWQDGSRTRGVYLEGKPVSLGRFEIATCKAHVASVCWLVRVWQKHTKSYVFQSAYAELDDAVRCTCV